MIFRDIREVNYIRATFASITFVCFNESFNSTLILMTDFLSSLNPEQRLAVEQTDGPLLILAGAGSGKTRVIAHRIAYLIVEKGVRPWNVLAVTFTNKAAEEMRARVQRLLRGQELSSVPWVSTFHSLCVRILRQDIEKLNEGYSKTFTIYDQDDSLRLIKNCLKDLGYDDKKLAPRAVQGAISGAKNRGEDVDAYAAQAEYVDERRASIARVYKLYEERLHANNALDFDDLLIKTVRLLRKDAEVREKYNNKFRYILVDEYQDTNSLQFALIGFLTEKQQNICVVGDEDQSIYKWRGADITNILNFEQHFPNTKIIRLEQNYRSTQTILDVAGAVVKNNLERKGKKLWTSNPPGERVRYYQAFDAEAEARFVASKIVEQRREQYDLRAAVLYRTNSQSRVFEEAMRRAGLAYNIVGGFSFYERMEVRDVIAYLKLALNPHDSIALARVINSPPRGIGKQTLEEIDRRARDTGLSHWETISLVIEKPENLSARAVSALRKFRGIVLRLGEMAKAETGRRGRLGDTETRGLGDAETGRLGDAETGRHETRGFCGRDGDRNETPRLRSLRVSVSPRLRVSASRPPSRRPLALSFPPPRPFQISSRPPFSIPAMRTRSSLKTLTRRKHGWKTCRNSSTQLSIMTNKASRVCASSSTIQRLSLTLTSTNTMRRSP